jgi:alkylation response protein AidB-like acyl-CoA dehydrogenase
MEVGRGCGASGWLSSFYAGHNYMSGYYGLEAQQEYWGDNPDRLSATASSVARLNVTPERDGWRVRDSQLRFSSGCDAAEWVHLMTKEGSGLVPRSDFKILDDWHTSGLRGSGSKSVVIEDAWVPPHRIISMESLTTATTPGAKLYPDMPFYHAPFSLVANQLLLAPLIGMARGVLDLFEERVVKRIDLHTGKKASEGAGAQLRFAESHAEVEMAMMFIRRNCETLARWGATRTMPTTAEKAALRRDITYAARVCVQSTQRLMSQGDASGMFDVNAIGRLSRDVYMAGLQAGLTWDEPAQSFSRTRWGLPPSSIFNG